MIYFLSFVIYLARESHYSILSFLESVMIIRTFKYLLSPPPPRPTPHFL